MILVQFVQEAEILKYRIAEYNTSLDYMRAAMAPIGVANRIAIVAP